MSRAVGTRAAGEPTARDRGAGGRREVGSAPPRWGAAGRRLAGALALALAAACGGHRPATVEEGEPPSEVLVEVLPRSAEVTLDGVPLGKGSKAVPAPPPGPHVLAAAAEGYAPVERELPEVDLAGARVAAALRPLGLRTARELDFDDPEGLAEAAAFLAEEGDAADAVDYAERALALEPGLALAHRARGDALVRQGEGERAVAAWTEYLRLAPAAPDARRVARRIEEARGAAPPP